MRQLRSPGPLFVCSFDNCGSTIGTALAASDIITAISGPSRALLAAECTALNFLGHLLGGLPHQRQNSRKSRAHHLHAQDDPGLRALEKYAIRSGGGMNHRCPLHGTALIKDKHIAIIGGGAEVVTRAHTTAGHMVKNEVEVDRLDQLAEALDVSVDAVPLDNMFLQTLPEAVAMVAGRAITWVSGRVTRETAPAIAASRVDLIAVGWCMQSIPGWISFLNRSP